MTDLNALGWKLHDHLKRHRPRMFRQLRAEGRLNQYLLDQQWSISDSLASLEDQGLQPFEAEEMLRDRIYPPSEDDVPSLGGTLQPYTD